MTAVVGILNKQAVAIAADSAVTIDSASGHKIFNKANKVFALSKHHPVGIMIYNSASFMYTPWETVIKVYRKELRKRWFATLKEYQIDFLAFLRSKNFYTTPEIQLAFLSNLVHQSTESIVLEILNENPLSQNPTPDEKQTFLSLVESSLDEQIDLWAANSEVCEEFEDYDFDTFELYATDTIEGIKNKIFLANGFLASASLVSKLRKYAYHVLRAKEKSFNYTGLVFVGFGEEEIYPQLIPVNISMLVANRLRYYIEDKSVASISNENESSVRPFAQTDVIHTILSGVDPFLDENYLSNFEALFRKYNQAILALIGSSNPIVSAQIAGLDTQLIIDEIKQEMQEFKRKNYINPLMGAVRTLSKEDLAEMAESLIYLTYLKRRITFAEESVGGPVDVAVISKGDGFVWIKRKHYFKPELNQHFFDNYFRK